jgi:hypothetical protein
LALIVVASLLLIFVLIIASAIDYKTHKVNDFLWMVTFTICTLIMVHINSNSSLIIKTQILIITAGYIILSYLAGKIYYELKYYGGADIKFAMAVSVLLASFDLIGAWFYIWFLVVNPLFIFLGLKVATHKQKKVTLQSKFAFIPFMTLIFFGVCLIHILTVN